MPNLLSKRSRGITLLELMVTIAVLGIIASIAVPNLQQTIRANRVTSQHNELISLLHLARSQAIRLNSDVDLQLATQTNGGWTGRIWIDECVEEEGKPECPSEIPPECPSQKGFVRCSSNTGTTLSSQVETFPLTLKFNSRGYLSGSSFTERTIELQHSPCVGSRLVREITILPTGQVNFEVKDCSI